MGLDAVQIVMTVEEHFGITISDAESERLLRVSDLHACIKRKLEERQAQEKALRTWADGEILEEIRDIVVEEVGVPRERITWGARFHADLRID